MFPIEHIFLCLIAKPNNEIREIFREYGITRERFLGVLEQVRGNVKVTSDNPEEPTMHCLNMDRI